MCKLTENIITYLKENIDIVSMSQNIQNSHPTYMLFNSQDFIGKVELAFDNLIHAMKDNKQEEEDSEKVEVGAGKRKFEQEASDSEDRPKRQRLNQQKFVPWDHIPNEIWMKHVLSHLSDKDKLSMSLTSKRFNALSQVPSLWKELTLDYEQIMENPQSCYELVERCTKLKSLRITNRNSYFAATPVLMNLLMKVKKTLTELRISSKIKRWNPYCAEKLGQLVHLKSLHICVEDNASMVRDEIKNLVDLEVLHFGRNLDDLPRSSNQGEDDDDYEHIQLPSILTKIRILDYQTVEDWEIWTFQYRKNSNEPMLMFPVLSDHEE